MRSPQGNGAAHSVLAAESEVGGIRSALSHLPHTILLMDYVEPANDAAWVRHQMAGLRADGELRVAGARHRPVTAAGRANAGRGGFRLCDTYCFERGICKDTGGDGWADVWKRDHFAWEYKYKRAEVEAAFGQLRKYATGAGEPVFAG